MRARWKLLLFETILGFLFMLCAVYVSRNVFLKTIQEAAVPPLSPEDILYKIPESTYVAYAPNFGLAVTIMSAAERKLPRLNRPISNGVDEKDLTKQLISYANHTVLTYQVVFVIWTKTGESDIWNFKIRSTEWTFRSKDNNNNTFDIESGFLAMQYAISQSILEYVNPSISVRVDMVSMPVSPLMNEANRARAIAWIVLWFTLAMLPGVCETETLVIFETNSSFKRALRLRDVSYSTIYLGWLFYGYMTALPICLISGIIFLLIFRWIPLFITIIVTFSYLSVNLILSFILALYEPNALFACTWSILFVLLQTFLAEIIKSHNYAQFGKVFSFFVSLLLPQLGLTNCFNSFASEGPNQLSLVWTIVAWLIDAIFYFMVLMLLQRIIRNAIGGRVHWRSIIMKNKGPKNPKIKYVINPIKNEREHLQEVDETVAKAITLRNVCKSVLNARIMENVTMDIYRNEFSIIYSDRSQKISINVMEDLLIGLTIADSGTINVLGTELKEGINVINEPYMVGYCHRAEILIDEFTVREHMVFFFRMSLWRLSKTMAENYEYLRIMKLSTECDLEDVMNESVKNISLYYKAQLCWAIALILEPKIIFIPNVDYTEKKQYLDVITDKIITYRNHLTIVRVSFSNAIFQNSDRIFVLDNNNLVFGGTPAYMFYMYGREYRLRVSFDPRAEFEHERKAELVRRALSLGAMVRAYLGSLLILRVPISPSENVAELVKFIDVNKQFYSVLSIHISLADFYEVCKRAIEVSKYGNQENSKYSFTSYEFEEALKNLEGTEHEKRNITTCLTFNLLNCVFKKYIGYYRYHKAVTIVMFLCAFFAGGFMFNSLREIIQKLDDVISAGVSRGETLNVESVAVWIREPNGLHLVVRSGSSSAAKTIARGFITSETNATQDELYLLTYTVLTASESLTDYLMTTAIDAPVIYVRKYAYGMDVKIEGSVNPTINVHALYSGYHRDKLAMLRALSRTYTSVLRYLTNNPAASIQVVDDPLTLDTTATGTLMVTPIMMQFLLILAISHMTLVPSYEHKLIRHMQANAANFSPIRYWMSLYICDSVVFLGIMIIITGTATALIMFFVKLDYFYQTDLLILPLVLLMYGFGCIPQAYLFSLSPNPTLNSLSYLIVNLVFGEITVVTKLWFGNSLNFILASARLSPQYNMAIAFVKIKALFAYNSECLIFKAKKVCEGKLLHKCCSKCGLMEKCFERAPYIYSSSGLRSEMIWTGGMSVVTMFMIILWEYKHLQRICSLISNNLIYRDSKPIEPRTEGASKTKALVLEEERKMHSKLDLKYGDCLLVKNMSLKVRGIYVLKNLYFGVSCGECVALTGLNAHGRGDFCELLAGYNIPTGGNAIVKSRWSLSKHPHRYAKNVSLSHSSHDPLPFWLTARNGLEVLATLRGVPKKKIKDEVDIYIKTLELDEFADKRIVHLDYVEKIRLNFAAAVVGAPPVIIVDECTAFQKYTVKRAMYFILSNLKNRGHAVILASVSVESHMPVTNKLAIVADGYIHDVGGVDELVAKYGNTGFTVVVHLKDEVNIRAMFSKYFRSFVVNDISEVLVNIQVRDGLNWTSIFEKMERLKSENQQVYSYIIAASSIDFIYNQIISGMETNQQPEVSCICSSLLRKNRKMISPKPETIAQLQVFEKRYSLTKLIDLPWSVIFLT